MTDNEVEVYIPAPPPTINRAVTDDWFDAFGNFVKLANHIANTEFVPEDMRGFPDKIAAAMLTGREMGIPPMTALRHLYVVRGRVGQSAEIMRVQILRAGHSLKVIEATDARCIIEGKRKDETEWTRVQFALDDARKNNVDVRYWAADKLFARATARLARRKFADALTGLPVLEEIEDGSIPDDAIGAAEVTTTTIARKRRGRPPKARDTQPPPTAAPAKVTGDTEEDYVNAGVAATTRVVDEPFDAVAAELGEPEPEPTRRGWPGQPQPPRHATDRPTQAQLVKGAKRGRGTDDRSKLPPDDQPTSSITRQGPLTEAELAKYGPKTPAPASHDQPSAPKRSSAGKAATKREGKASRAPDLTPEEIAEDARHAAKYDLRGSEPAPGDGNIGEVGPSARPPAEPGELLTKAQAAKLGIPVEPFPGQPGRYRIKRPPTDTPDPPATREQINKLFAQWAELDVTDDDDRHILTGEILGYPSPSYADLTGPEASRILEWQADPGTSPETGQIFDTVEEKITDTLNRWALRQGDPNQLQLGADE